MSAGRLLAERKFQDRRLCDSPTDGFSRVLRDQAAWRAEWRQPSGTLSLHRFDSFIFDEGKGSGVFLGKSLVEKRRRSVQKNSRPSAHTNMGQSNLYRIHAPDADFKQSRITTQAASREVNRRFDNCDERQRTASFSCSAIERRFFC